MKIKLHSEVEPEYILGTAISYSPIDKSITMAVGIFKYTFSITIKINSK
jgi:hypothetical protein